MTPREELLSATILCKAKIAVSIISLQISYEDDDDDHLGAARHCMRIVPPLPGRNLTTMRRVKKSQQCDRGTDYDHHDFYSVDKKYDVDNHSYYDDDDDTDEMN